MLKEVEKKVRSNASLINAPQKYLPTFGSIRYDATPVILYKDGFYHYLIQEGNEEIE